MFMIKRVYTEPMTGSNQEIALSDYFGPAEMAEDLHEPLIKAGYSSDERLDFMLWHKPGSKYSMWITKIKPAAPEELNREENS